MPGISEELNPYTSLLGAGPQAPQTPPAYGPITQSQPDVSAIERPATSPEEIEQRKAGWQQVLSNPNFIRALGFMGAQLMQPVQPGQTRMGHFGAAAATGMTVMQMGEYAQYEQDLAAKKEARAQKESDVNIEGTRARTETERAQLPGVKARSDVDVGSAQAKIAKAKTESDKAKFDLEKATKVEEVDAIERDLAKRKLNIQKEIPDASLRAAALAEVDAAGLTVQEARQRIATLAAQAGSATAAAKASGVKTAADQITVDVLTGMDAQEKKEFLTKTGRYSTHVSTFGNQTEGYGKLYDGLKKSAPNDPRIKGKTREQFQMDGLSSLKQQDASPALKNYIAAISMANMDPDPDIVAGLSEQMKSNIAAKKGSPSQTSSGKIGGVEDWVRDKSGKLVRKSVEPAK